MPHTVRQVRAAGPDAVKRGDCDATRLIRARIGNASFSGPRRSTAPVVLGSKQGRETASVIELIRIRFAGGDELFFVSFGRSFLYVFSSFLDVISYLLT